MGKKTPKTTTTTTEISSHKLKSDSVRLRTLLKATTVTLTIFKMKGTQIVLDNWNNDCEPEWV